MKGHVSCTKSSNALHEPTPPVFRKCCSPWACTWPIYDCNTPTAMLMLAAVRLCISGNSMLSMTMSACQNRLHTVLVTRNLRSALCCVAGTSAEPPHHSVVKLLSRICSDVCQRTSTSTSTSTSTAQHSEWVITCAGDEAQSIIARLHVLPEVDVGVVENVLMQVEVVEALRGKHHPHIITCHAHHHTVSNPTYTDRQTAPLLAGIQIAPLSGPEAMVQSPATLSVHLQQCHMRMSRDQHTGKHNADTASIVCIHKTADLDKYT